MKFILTLALCFLFISSYAQTYYCPSKPKGTSETKYRRGRLILQNAYDQIKGEDNGIVAYDYWNIATAYLIMEQPSDSVYYYLTQAKKISPKDFCKINQAYIDYKGGLQHTGFYKELGEMYVRLVGNCGALELQKKEIDLEKYARIGGFDFELIKQLDRIGKLDQKYRSGAFSSEQKSLDKQNRKEIKNIIEAYGYPGRTLVGEKYESVAWAIIQHADLEFQERYVQLVYEAVLKNELAKAPFQMLVDRIYLQKEGYQIFGSQVGAPFGSDKEIEKVKNKFDLK